MNTIKFKGKTYKKCPENLIDTCTGCAFRRTSLSNMPIIRCGTNCNFIWKEIKEIEMRKNTLEEMQIVIQNFKETGKVYYQNKECDKNVISNPCWDFNENFYTPFKEPIVAYVNLYLREINFSGEEKPFDQEDLNNENDFVCCSNKNKKDALKHRTNNGRTFKITEVIE